MSFTVSPFIAQLGRRTSGGPTTTRPKAVQTKGTGDQRVAARRPLILTVRRAYDGASAAIEGTVKLWGAMLGMIEGALAGAAQTAQRFVADGVQTTFQTDIDFASFSNYNFLVRKMSDSRGAITGTVSVTAASKTVTGSGTAFDTECHIGAKIIVGTQVREIQSIGSATSLTVSLAFDSTAAGATATQAVDGFSGLSGTVAVTSGSPAVAGTNTVFTEQVHAGEDIVIAGNRYTILEVTSDTALILTSSALATNAVARAFGESMQFLTQDSTPDNGWDFGVTSGVGAKALITLGAAPLAGSIFEVYKVTPVEVLADGSHPFDRIQVLGQDVYWMVGTHDGVSADISATAVNIEPAFTQ
jgi:hypothetical protein